jgi:hypothetical protein
VRARIRNAQPGEGVLGMGDGAAAVCHGKQSGSASKKKKLGCCHSSAEECLPSKSHDKNPKYHL